MTEFPDFEPAGNESEWRFDSRADFERVLLLEFPPDVADPWLADHPGALGVSYGYVLFSVDAAVIRTVAEN